jgi:hypothetical protein
LVTSWLEWINCQWLHWISRSQFWGRYTFIRLGWSLTIVTPNDVMSWWLLCSHNDHQPFRSATPSLTHDIKPNRKHIRTKRLNYHHLIQSPNADLSLRPYLTILVQIKPNLQGCIIKVVLVLTSIPYQIPKILKSNILKIKGIEILYPLYTYNPSYALVDHLQTHNRLGPIFRWAKALMNPDLTPNRSIPMVRRATSLIPTITPRELINF